MSRFIVHRRQLGSRLVTLSVKVCDHHIRIHRPSLQRYFNFKAFAFFRMSSRLARG